MIIGITGTLGAGKGTIVELLKKRGFKHYSVRGFLIEEIKVRNLPINRDSMVIVANLLRNENSPSYIATKLYEIAEKNGGNSVIESLRAVGEVKELKKNKDFYLFSVDANIKKRYERIIKRGSESDKVSYEKFLEDEKREMENSDPAKQDLKKCIEMSDFKFRNNGTIKGLEKKVEEILRELKFK
ncbi:MAG: AAA family ATPase [Nanoarchaeota archaeon]|nr:AAA family ATPase [Nanoarchaeota archaeon]